MNDSIWKVFGIAITVAFVIIFLLMLNAGAHEAKTGWSYDQSCCSDRDCREIPSESVKEMSGGYTVPNGEVIPYSSNKIKQSKDEYFHWCTWGGRENSSTICLYVPLKGF